MRVTRQLVLLLALTSAFAAVGGADASAAGRTAAVALPARGAAQAIVTRLWNQRELALANLDPGEIRLADWGMAQALDTAFIASVHHGVARAKAAHPIDSLRVALPGSSVLPSFLAEVRTTNEDDGSHPWYVVAVAREAGDWRFVFVTYAGDAARAPLPAGTPAALTAGAHTEMTRLARLGARRDAAKAVYPIKILASSVRTSRSSVEPGADGVYGLAYPSGQVLSCYTIHVRTRLSAPGKVLVQIPPRDATPVLHGSYRSVVVEEGRQQCALGAGSAGKVVMDYDTQLLGITGVPA